MRLVTSTGALLGAVLFVSACSVTPEPDEVTTAPAVDVDPIEAVEEPRRIALTKGDTMTVSVDAEGVIEVEVIILEGKADAGTYSVTSTSEGFYLTATAAKDELLEPDAEVSVTVDSENRIVTVGLGH